MKNINNSKNKYTVSIIIPAHNAAKTISSTLQSALRQTYRDMEIIVADDGSSDGTDRIIDEFAARDGRIRNLRQKQGGVAAARNLALAHATGAFVAPLDADDIWHATKIARQVEAFQAASADCGIVYCNARTIDEQGRVIGDIACPSPVGRVYPCMLNSNFIRCASIPLIRRDLLEQVGGYDASLRTRGAEGSEDFHLYLSLSEICEFSCVGEYLVGYRQSGNNMSTRITQNLNSWHLVLAAARESHPELPGWLFRWAAGNFHRWLGLRAMAGGEPGKGAWLLLRALTEDPGGTLKPDVMQASLATALAAGAGGLGLRRPLGTVVRALGRRTSPAEATEPPTFDSLDPRLALSSPIGWEVRRMERVAQLSVPATGSRRKFPAPGQRSTWPGAEKRHGAQVERP